MHRILINHPAIGSYSFFLFAGILFGYLLSRWRAKKFGVAGAHIDNVALLAAIFGLFGARLFSWLFYFPPGVSLWRAFMEPGGGMVFYGGVICGFAAVATYTFVRRVSLVKLLDVLAPGLILGLMLGRVGCFMAGCCWGDLCEDRASISKVTGSAALWQIQTFPVMSKPGFPFAVHFPPEAGAFDQHVRLGLIDAHSAQSLAVHPVQIYEAVLAFVLFVILARMSPLNRPSGEIISCMFLGYAAIRFATEFIRADNAPKYFGLTLSQVISIGLAISAGLYFLWLRLKKPVNQILPSQSLDKPVAALPIHELPTT